MNFKIGGEYKTRNGLRAKITRMVDGFMWARVYTNLRGAIDVHYFKDGRYHLSVDTALDIVGPWVPSLYVGKKQAVFTGEVLNGILFFRGEEASGLSLSEMEGCMVWIRIEEK